MMGSWTGTDAFSCHGHGGGPVDGGVIIKQRLAYRGRRAAQAAGAISNQPYNRHDLVDDRVSLQCTQTLKPGDVE